jgi:hypothetical protein
MNETQITKTARQQKKSLNGIDIKLISLFASAMVDGETSTITLNDTTYKACCEMSNDLITTETIINITKNKKSFCIIYYNHESNKYNLFIN